MPVSSSLCQLGGTTDQRVLPSVGGRRLGLRRHVRPRLLRRGGGLGGAQRPPVSPQRHRRQGTLAPGLLQPDLPLRRELRGLRLRGVPLRILGVQLCRVPRVGAQEHHEPIHRRAAEVHLLPQPGQEHHQPGLRDRHSEEERDGRERREPHVLRHQLL